MLEKITKLFNHPFWDTLIIFIKKFKSSKSYWSISSLILIFTLREAIVWKFGSAIRVFCEEQAKGSDYATIWDIVGFVFDVGGSWELVVLGVFFFVGVSIVEVKSPKSDEVISDKLDLILQSLPASENKDNFLKEYFGEDYEKALENPQTYHNLKLKLSTNTKTTEELLKEKEELFQKIQSQSLKSSIQKLVDQAFKELRYEDVRVLLDEFIVNNQSIADDLIKAHYQKALAYIEELEYHKAKEEFEEFIPIGIKDAKILREYGSLSYILGEYDSTVEYNMKSLALNIEEFGEKHFTVASNYNEIGMAWHDKGEYDRALEFYNKSLRIRITTLGENHSDTAESYNNIGGVWGSKGEYDKGIEFHNKSLKIRLFMLGENYSDTAESYNNIGLLWKSKEYYDKAIKFYNKSLKILISIYGDNHPNIASLYNNIGSAWKSKEKYSEAISFYNKSLNIRLATFGENHPHTATSYNNIAGVREGKKDYLESIEYYRKALKILITTVGENHPYVKTCRASLVRVKSKL